MSVLDGVFERRDQALIFREVIGLMAKILAECGNFSSGFVLGVEADISFPNTVTGNRSISSPSMGEP